MSGEKEQHYEMTILKCRDCHHEWEVNLPMKPDGEALRCPKCDGIGVYTGRIRSSFCPDGRMMVSEEAPPKEGPRNVIDVDW